MSFDGYTSGPNQSLDAPLGVGAERLHDWVIPLRVWRAAHGQAGGEVNESARVVEAEIANIGATIMGRNMFGVTPADGLLPTRGRAGGERTRHSSIP